MNEIESINALNADLLSPEEVDRFSDPKEARKKAMDYLARREYGQRELEQKLIAAGFASVIVTAPLILLVLIFQRRIVSGLTLGGVKG